MSAELILRICAILLSVLILLIGVSSIVGSWKYRSIGVAIAKFGMTLVVLGFFLPNIAKYGFLGIMVGLFVSVLLGDFA